MPPHELSVEYVAMDTVAAEEQQQQQPCPGAGGALPEQQRRRAKKITFALERNAVRAVTHIRDMSKSDVSNTWYNRSDFERIKQEIIPLIRRMMKGDVIEETDRQTTRGLEYRTRNGALRRQHNKLDALQAVLDEQERQMAMDGRRNDELLSRVYRDSNSHCQEAACALGVADETTMKRELSLQPLQLRMANNDELTVTTDSEGEESDQDVVMADQRNTRNQYQIMAAGGQKTTMNKLGNLFKQVLIRRRALLHVDGDSTAVLALEHTRSMPQAA